MLVDMLVWQASGVEYDMGVGHAGKVRVHASAKLGERSTKQAQGANDTVSLRSPSRSAPSARGRRCRHAWQGRIKGQRPRQLSMGISSDGICTKCGSLRMLGEKAPKKHQLPPQQVSTWLTAALGGDNESDAVGSVGVVGRDACSDGRRKLSHRVVSRWR